MSRRIGILALLGALILVTDARAQAQTGNTVPDERPATTTIMGDTGLWFVPTGEVLKAKDWSVSGYRANWDVHQGFTDISHFIGTFGYAYARIAQNPRRYRPFIELGAIGKLLAVVAVTGPWLAGEVGWQLPLVVSGDVVFALLFIDFLRRTRSA